MTRIPFCGEAYKDRTDNANAQASVNFYPMRSPTASEPDRLVMYPTPGYLLEQDTTALGITGTGAIRGAYEINDTAYVLSGSKLLRMTGSGSPYAFADAGTLYTSSGRCNITCNTVELVISDGSYGYVYNLSTGVFAVVSGGGFPAAGGVTNFDFMDGYVLAGVNGTSRVIQSDLLAGGTYGVQAFTQVTSFPDSIRRVYSDQLQLYIMGPKLTEVRANSGAIPFAFEKVGGVLIQAGVVAPETVTKVGTTVMWLARDSLGKAYVAALKGYQIQVISTPPINEAIERYETISDAFAYSYREADNQFYVMTFPSANVTWAYDTKMGMWHQRSVNGGRDLPDHCIAFQGKRLVGDSSGKLYWMSQDYSTDGNGNYLQRVRTCQHVDAGGKATFLRQLEIDFEAGVGLVSGQGSDPLATLEVSKDNGNTWVSVGTLPMGRTGQYKQRLVWRRLGWAWQWTFRLTVSDPVRAYIMGANGDFMAGWK